MIKKGIQQDPWAQGEQSQGGNIGGAAVGPIGKLPQKVLPP